MLVVQFSGKELTFDNSAALSAENYRHDTIQVPAIKPRGS